MMAIQKISFIAPIVNINFYLKIITASIYAMDKAYCRKNYCSYVNKGPHLDW